jgi:murein L,D-transpeptidase YcbB/YkuD
MRRITLAFGHACRAALVVLAMGAAGAAALPPDDAAPADATAGAIREFVASTAPRLRPDEHAALQRLYRASAHAPRWLDASGGPSGQARTAIERLARAADEGLDPAAYGAADLAAAAPTVQAGPRASSRAAAAWDVQLSLAMLRYLRHLHIGRVDPRSLGWRLPHRGNEHDPAAVLGDALADGGIELAVDSMMPPLSQYRRLRDMLARYRALAAGPRPAPLSRPAASLRSGDAYADAAALHERLVMLGDLPDAPLAVAAPALRYEGALVEGVRRFQARHGLATDGVLGASTLAALNVPLERRVRQIELALERLRWLPHLDGRRMVAINIPMFRLWAWDPRAAAGMPPQDMGVIVGRALKTQTPVLVEEMRHVVFRPYWNVPRSILRNEILPKVVRDASYLARHDMDIVRGAGDDAQPVAATPQNIELLGQGALRLRQRPGPHNSLGLVKFAFPNNENVYMHGTPAPELFARTRRDFSHGCIRLEDPVSMAAWVLGDQPSWTRERIVSAMSGARPVRVDLATPIQVVLFYTTAAVGPGDGTVRFADDIYRHDARLEAALQALR